LPKNCNISQQRPESTSYASNHLLLLLLLLPRTAVLTAALWTKEIHRQPNRTRTRTIHKLRDEMLERDAQYRTMLLGFQNVVAKLAMILETQASTLQTENKDMKRSIQMYEYEYESVLILLARAANESHDATNRQTYPRGPLFFDKFENQQSVKSAGLFSQNLKYISNNSMCPNKSYIYDHRI
jgi:hypothetical protein